MVLLSSASMNIRRTRMDAVPRVRRQAPKSLLHSTGVVALILCGCLWGLSLWHPWYVWGSWFAELDGGTATVAHSRVAWAMYPNGGGFAGFSVPGVARWIEFQWGPNIKSLNLPLWLVVLLALAVLLPGQIHRRRRTRVRLQLCLCVSCTYDLRGSPPGNCPECGTPIPEANPYGFVG